MTLKEELCCHDDEPWDGQSCAGAGAGAGASNRSPSSSWEWFLVSDLSNQIKYFLLCSSCKVTFLYFIVYVKCDHVH